MDENEITQRLRDAGDQPVPGEVRAGHLSQMHAAVPTVEEHKRFGRLAVAAAAFVGFAVGSTGFAMAGALPDPAQQVAHDVLAVVQVDVEDPKNRGQCISNAARTIDDPAAKKAAKQDCKAQFTPGRSGQAGPPDGTGQGRGRPDHAGPPEGHPNDDTTDCKGKPPWAGKGAPTYSAEEKAAFNQSCGRDVDDENEIEAPEIEEPEAEELEPAEPQDPGRPEGLPEQAPADPGPADPGAAGDAPPADTGPSTEIAPETETQTETETGAG